MPEADRIWSECPQGWTVDPIALCRFQPVIRKLTMGELDDVLFEPKSGAVNIYDPRNNIAFQAVPDSNYSWMVHAWDFGREKLMDRVNITDYDSMRLGLSVLLSEEGREPHSSARVEAYETEEDIPLMGTTETGVGFMPLWEVTAEVHKLRLVAKTRTIRSRVRDFTVSTGRMHARPSIQVSGTVNSFGFFFGYENEYAELSIGSRENTTWNPYWTAYQQYYPDDAFSLTWEEFNSLFAELSLKLEPAPFNYWFKVREGEAAGTHLQGVGYTEDEARMSAVFTYRDNGGSSSIYPDDLDVTECDMRGELSPIPVLLNKDAR